MAPAPIALPNRFALTRAMLTRVAKTLKHETSQSQLQAIPVERADRPNYSSPLGESDKSRRRDAPVALITWARGGVSGGGGAAERIHARVRKSPVPSSDNGALRSHGEGQDRCLNPARRHRLSSPTPTSLSPTPHELDKTNGVIVCQRAPIKASMDKTADGDIRNRRAPRGTHAAASRTSAVDAAGMLFRSPSISGRVRLAFRVTDYASTTRALSLSCECALRHPF
ncbi:unnamed protein product [Lampetra planeri]